MKSAKEYLKEGVILETATLRIFDKSMSLAMRDRKTMLCEIGLGSKIPELDMDDLGQFITDAINEKLLREREGG